MMTFSLKDIVFWYSNRTEMYVPSTISFIIYGFVWAQQ